MERMRNRHSVTMLRALLLAFVFACAFLISPVSADETPDELHIDADSVVYQENTGKAVADGSVKVSSKSLRLFAPRVEYSSNNQLLEAFSDERGKVTLLSGPGKITGDHLTYSVETRRGVLKSAAGKVDAFFIRGSDLTVISLDDALKLGIVTSVSKSAREPGTAEDFVAEWMDVTTTTCDFERPHYRLVSKKVTVIPGKKVVIKNPKVYIGESCIFTYPFDYIAKLSPKEQSVMPYLAYESDKGLGVGIKGTLDLNKIGDLEISGIYWTEDIWEAKLSYRKEIIEGLSLFVSSNRLYNSDEKETLWRPKWGLEYNLPSGWRAVLFQSQRELVETEMRPGLERRYNVWSDPELGIYSPWYGDAAKGFSIRGFGIFGRYQDNYQTSDEWTQRLVAGAEFKGAPDVGEGKISPYYGARYVYHSYDGEDESQQITDGWIGFKWSLGEVEFDSMYFRRWAQGTTPLGWDRYDDNDTFYQTVSFPLNIGRSWEKWTFSVRVAYDSISNEIADMRYSLDYNKHCVTWHLWVRDERAGGEVTAGLFFYINAYPEYKLGAESETNSEATRKSF